MSFLNLAVAFPLISLGPIVPAGQVASHFQVPSKGFMNVSSSFDGVGGAGGVAGAAAGAAAAVGAAAGAAGFAAGAAGAAGLAAGAMAGAGAAGLAAGAAGLAACANAAAPVQVSEVPRASDRILVSFMGALLEGAATVR